MEIKINATAVKTIKFPEKVLTNKHSKFKGCINPVQSANLIYPPKVIYT